jgi:DNA-binding PadR family transcriptional regulator
MPAPSKPQLSLNEWLVLCLVCEKPTHGFALAGLLSRYGNLGRVYQVHKSATYRALTRLEQLALIQTTGEQHAHTGPARSLVKATQAGRSAARGWLRTPVAHGRDVRTELMLKLALLHRAGKDPTDLLNQQRAAFAPRAAALASQVHLTTGIEHTLALWRHESMSATIHFLDELTWQADLTPSS